jgi:hypothetical protein
MISLLRNTLEERDLLQMWVKGEMIKEALNFKIFMGILLYPYKVVFFSDLVILLISYMVAYFQLILENMLLKFVIK